MSLTRSRRAWRGLLPVLALPLVGFAFDESVAASALPTTPDDSAPTESIPDGYVRLVDDTAFLTVVVPETWDVVNTAPGQDSDGNPQPLILASTVDLEDFNTTFESGVLYYRSPYQADPEAVIDASGLRAGCELIEVQPYEDPIFTGSVQVGTGCGTDGGTWNMIVASPEDQSFTAIVQLQILSSEEQEAFDVVLASFTYAGDPTVDPDMLVPSSVSVASVPG